MTKTTSNRHWRQSGATSIFIVIFAALLLSVMTLSFAGLMSRELRRSSDDELSQSAYDSALAGVEDAKRVIMAARGSGSAADTAKNAIAANKCNTIAAAGIAGDPSSPEVLIQSSSTGGGAQLNQAYTCVKIDMTSPDYELELEQTMQSELVPLRAASAYEKIQIEWHEYRANTLVSSCGNGPLSNANSDQLCTVAAWKNPNPDQVATLLRAQIITPGSSFTLNSLNNDNAGNSVFMYPSDYEQIIDLGTMERYVDGNGTTSGSIHQTVAVECEPGPLMPDPDAAYHCKGTITLPAAVSPAASRNAILRLTSIYSPTKVRIMLLDASDNPVPFNGVQPRVDSTGRANDLFRRVEARLNLSSDVTYPEAALDTDGSICKDFYVTASGTGTFPSDSGLTCTP